MRMEDARLHLLASGVDVSKWPNHRRLPVWDPVQRRKIAGTGAPKVKDAIRFFARFPYMSVYIAADPSGDNHKCIHNPRSSAARVPHDSPISLRVTRGSKAIDPEEETRLVDMVRHFYAELDRPAA